MGNTCNCVKRQTLRVNGRASENNIAPTNGVVSRNESIEATDSASSVPATRPTQTSQQFIVVNQTGTNSTIVNPTVLRQGPHNTAGRGTVMLVTSQRRPDLKTLILDTLRLIRSLTAKLVILYSFLLI